MTSDPGECCILQPSAALRLHTRRSAVQTRKVPESDSNEMTGRQEGTADGGRGDCPEISTSIYKNPQFPPSGTLSCTVSSIFRKTSQPMALTHVHRAMEIAPFTVIPYEPKIQKPSNRSDHRAALKSLALQPGALKVSQRTDSNNLCAETSPENRLLAKDTSDRGVAAGNAVGLVNDPKCVEGPAKHANASTARNDSDADSDDEFPSVRRLLSPEYKWKLMEEGSLLKKDIAGKKVSEAVDDLFGFGSTAGSSQEKPIVLGSDDGPEDGHDDIDKGRAPIVRDDGEPLEHYALDLNIPPWPLSTSADGVDDGGIDEGDTEIGSNLSQRRAKRQRSRSPLCEPNSHYTSTPPLSYHEGGKNSMANTPVAGSDELGGDTFLSKRRKLPGFLDSRTVFCSPDAQSPHSFLPELEESEKPGDGTDVSTNLPVEDHLASTARTTPELSVSGSLRESQPSPELADSSQDWEVREVIGKEYVDGVLHYMVDWCPTLLPEHSLEHAKELVDAFEVRLRALRKDKETRAGPSVKRDRQVTMEGDVSGGHQMKRPRGRPRKQK